MSMWVGQSERRVRQLFHAAAAAGEFLVLDEFDAQATARGVESHSRHDASLVNTLLRAIELHNLPFAAITNRADVLDAAILRRFTNVIRMDAPPAAERVRIWRGLLSSLPGADTVDYEALGRRFAFTGGRIRNVAQRVAVCVEATGACLDMALIERAARREEESLWIGRPARVGFGGGVP
jgi:SpoVK/Ycf46/Vps4 family AAA+-type ATPase